MTIRIAKGPPTCEGNYLGLIQDDYWFPFRVEFQDLMNGTKELCAWATKNPDETGWVFITDMDIISKWSEPIPDPIEESEDE